MNSTETRTKIWGLARIQEEPITKPKTRQISNVVETKDKNKQTSVKITNLRIQLTPDSYIIANYQSGGEGGIKIADPKKRQTIPLPKEPKKIHYTSPNDHQIDVKIPDYSTDPLVFRGSTI